MSVNELEIIPPVHDSANDIFFLFLVKFGIQLQEDLYHHLKKYIDLIFYKSFFNPC